ALFAPVSVQRLHDLVDRWAGSCGVQPLDGVSEFCLHTSMLRALVGIIVPNGDIGPPFACVDRHPAVDGPSEPVGCTNSNAGLTRQDVSASLSGHGSLLPLPPDPTCPRASSGPSFGRRREG